MPKRGASNEPYSPIEFVRAEAGYIGNTSDLEIVWPGEGSPVQSGLISKNTFAEGATKKVYKV